MPRRILVLSVLFALCAALIWINLEEKSRALVITPQEVDRLWAAVRVVQDSDGVPHVFAQNDHDGNFVLGYLHARDRLFQMDESRRFFSGTVAELLGGGFFINQDIQLRTLGLRRAAELSWDAYPPNSQLVLQAYADGVNAYLAQGNPLPPEYAALELTSIPAWTAVDSLTVAKGLAFGLSFDLDDTERSLVLDAYVSAGQSGGFDGQALFTEDLFRSAPFDPSVSIPPNPQSAGLRVPVKPPRLKGSIAPQTAQLIRDYLGRLRKAGLKDRFSAERRAAGSNWWIVSPDKSATGNALLANDPHLSLGTPSIFYEAHLRVSSDPVLGPMNVAGVTFPGAPSFVQGCNDRICWGSTVNPMDVTDFFSEELELGPAADPVSGCVLLGLTITASRFQGETEEVELIPQTYMFNQVGNGTDDDIQQAFIGPLEGGCTIIVPRHGPVVAAATPDLIGLTATGLSVQYTGFYATREGEAFFRMARARNLRDFREALQFFDVGSQNWGYADVEGNIAYFTSAEMPLREDLQAGAVDGGIPPFLVRDGTGALNHEWIPLADPGNPPAGQAIPFEILPFAEMPQVVNPAQGFIANANNDPAGTTLDNNAFNLLRPGGGIFYLSPGYTSLRIGRIHRLIEGFLNSGDNLIDLDELRSIQQNSQLLDPQQLVPFISQALDNAQDSDALSGFFTVPMQEAVQRLDDWDFSTPTGIDGGFDPADDPEAVGRTPVSQSEADASVAATIYSVWRGQFIRNTIDATLERIGLAGAEPDSERSLSALFHLLEGFDTNQGVGASGVDFFQAEGIASADTARDFLILTSLQDALALLASDDFASAFANSTNQDDYRWGRLHRIVFDHPLGAPFNVPNAAGFSDLDDGLPGVARSGGFESVDASRHSARADGVNEFMFGSGSARRFVGDLDPAGIQAQQILPGGQSGDVNSPLYASQLGRWLTHQFHPLRLTDGQVAADAVSEEVLVPMLFNLYFPFYQGNDQEFTAFAAANIFQDTSGLTFIAWSADGTQSAFPTNPNAAESLDPSRQLARLGSELFGLEISDVQEGWVELSVDPAGETAPLAPFVASFTQFGDFGLQRLDGAVAFGTYARQLIFTRLHHGNSGFRGEDSQTWLSLANPSDEPVKVDLRIVDSQSAAQPRLSPPPFPAQIASVEIPAKGVLFRSVTDLFFDSEQPQGYVKAVVTEGPGVVGLELIRLPAKNTVIALNASLGSGVNEAYSAQLASLAGIFTSIKLINTAEFPRSVTLNVILSSGQGSPPDPVTVDLAPGEFLEADAGSLFPTPLLGSLAVVADGPGVVGDVVFGDPDNLAFAAALPLQAQTFRRAVFGHVANLGEFFTGLALFNPGTEEAQVTIEVFNLDGQLAGSTQETLAAGGRFARTLVELVPQSAGQAGGYIEVRSTHPLVGQELFGTNGLTLQSAVPPTIIE